MYLCSSVFQFRIKANSTLLCTNTKDELSKNNISSIIYIIVNDEWDLIATQIWSYIRIMLNRKKVSDFVLYSNFLSLLFFLFYILEIKHQLKDWKLGLYMIAVSKDKWSTCTTTSMFYLRLRCFQYSVQRTYIRTDFFTVVSCLKHWIMFSALTLF